MKGNYKNGDKAIVIQELCGHQFKIGEVVTIISPASHQEFYQATNGIQEWYISTDELLPLEVYQKIKQSEENNMKNILNASANLSLEMLTSMKATDAQKLVERELTRELAKEMMKSSSIEFEQETDYETGDTRFTARFVALSLEEYRSLKKDSLLAARFKEFLIGIL